MSITTDPSYEKLMATVRVLDTHYGKLASITRRALLDAQFRNDKQTANSYRKIIRKMSSDHEAALDIIAERLTEPEQIQATRKALRHAADKAYVFIEKLKKTKVTLDNLTEAGQFMTQLVKDIRAVL